ncbi:hypothetical protein D1BOALGB6SA_2725 [Olavius sp. associated proteobacterium Delta 1]|nr:hypothetical protein D1BOALGB6SA_2725 [Olavius sp. associated proteobacterium Delta 1]
MPLNFLIVFKNETIPYYFSRLHSDFGVISKPNFKHTVKSEFSSF